MPEAVTWKYLPNYASDSGLKGFDRVPNNQVTNAASLQVLPIVTSDQIPSLYTTWQLITSLVSTAALGI